MIETFSIVKDENGELDITLEGEGLSLTNSILTAMAEDEDIARMITFAADYYNSNLLREKTDGRTINGPLSKKEVRPDNGATG